MSPLTCIAGCVVEADVEAIVAPTCVRRAAPVEPISIHDACHIALGEASYEIAAIRLLPDLLDLKCELVAGARHPVNLLVLAYRIARLFRQCV